MAEAQDVLDRYKSLVARRDAWKPLWQRLADIYHPTRGGFTAALVPGSETQADIYDSTPMQARRGLATAIDGLLKSSASRWFWVKPADEELNEDDAVKGWLEDSGNRMWDAIYSPRARFVHSSGAVDNDLATFGLGHLWIGENRFKNGLSFKPLFIGDVCFDVDADGVIDTYYLCHKFTARQAQQRFGDNVPPKVVDALKAPAKSGMSPQTFEFVQCIKPRGDRDERRRDTQGMPFESLILAVDDMVIVERGGFHELPIATPRWEVAAGELYPRSPGMMGLADSGTLQAMGHTLLVGGQRAVDPPTWVADDAVLSAVRTFPGGLTVVDAEAVRATGGKPIGQLDMGANIPVGREMQQDYRAMVEAAFFKNVFNLPIEVAGKMTATEVMERKEEFLRTIGPTMGQLKPDYIGHTVERVFGIMSRLSVNAEGQWIEGGPLPVPPEALQGRDIKFEFVDPVQRARKAIEGAGAARMLEFLAPVASIKPEVLDNYDFDEIARDGPEMFNFPQKWLKTKDVVAAERDQRAQMMQAQMMLSAGQQIADTVQSGAKANTELTKAGVVDGAVAA